MWGGEEEGVFSERGIVGFEGVGGCLVALGLESWGMHVRFVVMCLYEEWECSWSYVSEWIREEILCSYSGTMLKA